MLLVTSRDLYLLTGRRWVGPVEDGFSCSMRDGRTARLTHDYHLGWCVTIRRKHKKGVRHFGISLIDALSRAGLSNG